MARKRLCRVDEEEMKGVKSQESGRIGAGVSRRHMLRMLLHFERQWEENR